MDSWKVNAVRALRDAIPLKPKKYSCRIREWADKVSVLRDMSVDVLENKWTTKEFTEEWEKMKTRESEYGSSLRDSNFVAQRVEDTMSKSKAMKEMLADAFADMKTGHRVLKKISTEDQSLANRLAAFTQKLLDGVKKFFKAKEVREKYPSVTLTNKQFKDFATRINENICTVQASKASKTFFTLKGQNCPMGYFMIKFKEKRRVSYENKQNSL